MDKKNLYRVPNFLVIGAFSRNAGKTGFSGTVLKQSPSPIIAVKITVIKGNADRCPRGGEGCGVCTSLNSDFEISEETDPCRGKDTSMLLKAGASRVYWLKTRDHSVSEGFRALLELIPPGAPVLCESNSVMNIIYPGLFILLKARGVQREKDSAAALKEKADLIVETTGGIADFDYSRLSFSASKWHLD